MLLYALRSSREMQGEVLKLVLFSQREHTQMLEKDPYIVDPYIERPKFAPLLYIPPEVFS